MMNEYQKVSEVQAGAVDRLKDAGVRVVLFPLTVLMWFVGLFSNIFRGSTGQMDAEQKEGLLSANAGEIAEV
jgi:2-methylisocitrate lyase-like PEP mutase family enzyme